MGEINTAHDTTGSKRRLKKSSTRVDLTPMVDLGFLLITFFIFTTSMSEPKAMKLKLPVEAKPPNKTSEEKTINIIIDGNDRLWYYNGTSISSIRPISSKDDGIRKIIIDKKKQVEARYKSGETVVLIKPGPKSAYRDIIKILDEMTINNISRYTLMDPEEQELKTIEAK